MRPLFAATVFLLAGGFFGCARPAPNPTDPRDALTTLQAGNRRFADGRSTHPHSDAARRHETSAHGQHPFATIVACSDSRVPPEIIFDQGLGDLFVIRVAGNVCATDESGSIEYAVEHLKTPLIVVLGHSRCGAVTAVCEHASEHGNIEKLLEHIRPAVEAVRRRNPSATGDALVRAAVRENVLHTIDDLLALSDDVHRAVDEGRLHIVGAIYDLDGATVEWIDAHENHAPPPRLGQPPAS